jgi:hypothetical protein
MRERSHQVRFDVGWVELQGVARHRKRANGLSLLKEGVRTC